MKLRTVLIFVLVLCLAVSGNAFAKKRGGGKRLVLNLVGSGPMYESTVPDIDGDDIDDPAICFDVDLIDAKTRQHIGVATDCLSDVTGVGDGLALVGTTFFHTKKGTLVTRGNTTVKPVTHPTVTPDGQNITHITGASGTGNAVLGGTKRFKKVKGTVRLSGMVDLSNFSGAVGDPIAFDCVFVIDLYK